MTNKERAEKVKKILGLEETNYNDKNKYVRVADILCDLKHYSDANQINFMNELDVAETYYQKEND
jgi:hypothetical protein